MLQIVTLNKQYFNTDLWVNAELSDIIKIFEEKWSLENVEKENKPNKYSSKRGYV